MSDIRIIGGKWRGRKIQLAKNSQLRPTPDRVRETVFNWLMRDVRNSRCLDLFAGSGALGLEALSRGAEHVTFFENHKQSAQRLKQVIDDIGAQEHANVLSHDALKLLDKKPDQQFDGIFLDPPFRKNLLPQVIELLQSKQWLAPEAWIYIEAEQENSLDFLPSHWKLHREKNAGDVKYNLFYHSK